MYQALASAIITQAVEDLALPHPKNCKKLLNVEQRVKQSAREFLLIANEDLSFWCQVGGLNERAIIEQARKIERGELVIPKEAFQTVVRTRLDP